MKMMEYEFTIMKNDLKANVNVLKMIKKNGGIIIGLTNMD